MAGPQGVWDAARRALHHPREWRHALGGVCRRAQPGLPQTLHHGSQPGRHGGGPLVVGGGPLVARRTYYTSCVKDFGMYCSRDFEAWTFWKRLISPPKTVEKPFRLSDSLQWLCKLESLTWDFAARCTATRSRQVEMCATCLSVPHTPTHPKTFGREGCSLHHIKTFHGFHKAWFILKNVYTSQNTLAVLSSIVI